MQHPDTCIFSGMCYNHEQYSADGDRFRCYRITERCRLLRRHHADTEETAPELHARKHNA